MVAELAKAININPVLAAILVQRGVHSFEAAKSFFRPELSMLHDPYLMQDMDRAVVRIMQAIKQEEKILVYGDYDVDGTTSVAMMFHFLSKVSNNIEYYIPDRYKEGYGLSQISIDYATKEKFHLIITLDCGIKAVDLVQGAQKQGIDVVICDHHRPGKVMPPATAILDPARPDCAYPCKALSGCGVGFKLIQALNDALELEPEIPFDYLDLVAVSIASDIVPIVDENRILAYFGLQKLNTNPRPGLEALIMLAALKNRVDISGIVFGIGPRINAAGRLDHAHQSVDLLLAQDLDHAMQKAAKVNIKNDERRDIDKRITEEALAMISEDSSMLTAKSTVLFKSDWHKGVIGIVASRCIEHFYKPTIILTESDGKVTGSARSVPGFDIYEAIEACKDCLEQFGGHKYAAGLTLRLENVALFRQNFEKVVSEYIKEEQRTPTLEIDMDVTLDRLSPGFLDVLHQMAPFGPGNMQPVFVAKNLHLVGTPKLIKDAHLKFNVGQNGSDKKLEVIAFGMAAFLPSITKNNPFTMAFTLEKNEFQGFTTLQLRARDIKME